MNILKIKFKTGGLKVKLLNQSSWIKFLGLLDNGKYIYKMFIILRICQLEKSTF